MATTNLETILDALSTAIEAIAPEFRPAVPFKRWRGDKPIEAVSGPMRERAFGWRLGEDQTPRTMSSPTIHWQRNRIELHIGYNFEEPRQGDAQGIGPHQQAMADSGVLYAALAIGNPLAGVSNVKRMLWIGGGAPSRFTRVYRFDLEWAETFAA